MTHAMWLSCNQQVGLVQWQQTLTSTRAAVWDQFQQGTTNLLPVDQFYMMPGSHGFSLQQVLDLPLMTNCFGYMQYPMHKLEDGISPGHNKKRVKVVRVPLCYML